MNNSITIEIVPATTTAQYADATALILEYSQWLNFDLAFQLFDQEMASLSIMYNQSNGGLFVAYLDGAPVGVIGLRRLSETEGEVKRMFVQDRARGNGIGKMLLEKCIDVARALKYQSIKLDTTDFMKFAIKLYTDHGFREIPAYRYNPQEGARYFELRLQ
jgi:putative acetyltransferase